MKIIDNTIDIKPESKFDMDSVLFFDIETTGLSKDHSNIYLIGCAFKNENKWIIRQYLAENISDEEALVRSFYDLASKYSMIVHFNGFGFDVPFTDHKAALYGIEGRLCDIRNFDIFKRIRNARKFLDLESMSQKAIEAFLKIKRDDEMGGGQLISVFYDYAKQKDERSKRLLLLHNFDDILGMIKISEVTNYADILDGAFSVLGTNETKEYFTINAKLDFNVPRSFEKEKNKYIIAMNDDFMQVVIKKYSGVAKYPLDDYKNYYYLPKEDKVIHKDVAHFVGNAYKEKAKKNNCYIKKESEFLPQKNEKIKPCFYIDSDKKARYFEIEKAKNLSFEELKEYVLEIIRE